MRARSLATLIRETLGDSMTDADRRRLLKLQARLAMADGSGTEESVRILAEVIELDPLDGEALMLLGQHHAREGRPDQAILQYERAARIDAFAPQAKVRIAQVFVSQARFDEALPLLREAQSMRPRDDVARYIEQIERAAKGKRSAE
jgi:Flp pilus assembly protein TadD